jgi:CspA family cold shock protein
MEQGKVKWFDATKGFGFIEPNDGSEDVFVHMSEVKNAGYDNLNTNQILNYELQNNRGKSKAVNLKLI